MTERSYQGVEQYRLKVGGKLGKLYGLPQDGIHIHYEADFAKTDEYGNLVNEDYMKVSKIEDAALHQWTWASYKLSQMPGCCGLAVSYNAMVRDEQKGYGLGDYFHKERLKLIKDSGYSAAICTVTYENMTQKGLLLKNGWKMVHSFVNRRTKNTVEIWVKDIN